MYKLSVEQHALLIEALRRFELGVRRDGINWTMENLTTAWTGLGELKEYQTAVDAGLMRYAKKNTGTSWWILTEQGAKIVMSWHLDGYGLKQGQVTIDKAPPREGELSKNKVLVVTFTVTYKTEIIIEPDDVLKDRLSDIDIPETSTVKYVTDTFEAQTVTDNGEPVEIPD